MGEVKPPDGWQFEASEQPGSVTEPEQRPPDPEAASPRLPETTHSGAATVGSEGQLGPKPAAARTSTPVRGEARAIQRITENGFQILAFRIERYDRNGNRLGPVAVQLKAAAFDGAVNDGDLVEASGRWKDGTLHGRRLVNLTTGATVKARAVWKTAVVALSALALVACVFVVVISRFASADQERRDAVHDAWCQDAADAGLTPPGCEPLP